MTIRTRLEELTRKLRGEPPITPGDFNLDTLPHLIGRDDPVIVEIGCNDGQHTERFLNSFANPRIYAFEPDPRARQRFRERIHSPRVTLFEIAVAQVDGDVPFYMSDGAPDETVSAQLPQGWDLSGSIRKPTGHLEMLPWCTFDKQLMVRGSRLDSWCEAEGVGRIDFIWADVQGAEADLIDGGLQALARTRYFYTEYNNDELYEGQLDLSAILKRLPDFTVVARYATDVLLKNKHC